MDKINHVDIEKLIPAEERAEVLESTLKRSKILPLMTRLPNMSTNKERLKVLDVLPSAYWVEGGSQGIKKTTKQAYKDLYVYAEKIACIVPIAIDDLEDSNYDLWGSVRPRVEEAMYNAIDSAILFGKNKPASFPKGIVDLAFEKGKQVVQGQSETLYSVLDRAMANVEAAGKNVDGLVGGLGTKSAFRKLQDTTGQLIVGSEINDLPKYIVDNGSWDNSKAHFIVGSFKQAFYSIRKELSFKLLTEATIKDPVTDEEIFLAQQNMVALLCEMRLGWNIALPSDIATDEPFAFSVVVPAANKITVSATPEATFEESIDVELSANVAGAKIYYTDDGSAPSSASTLYTAPITLEATTTIKAIAYKDDYATSEVVSKTYTLAESAVVGS